MNTANKADALPCILLVEDSTTTATVLSRYLAEQYQLVRAVDGEEAWSILQERPDIELVITDIQMPRLTGHQLLVRLRRSDVAHLRSMPVIVMTTGDDTTDRNLAFLNGANDFINKPIDEMELQARVKVHYSLAHTIRELEESRRLLEEQATTDPLTHLKNRRAFFEAGGKALATARRYNGDLSVVIVDIDFFKRINDTHGHHGGDEALVAIAQLLGSLIRAEDTCARVGGEEFALLLPGTNRLGAAVLAERIRAAVERTPFLVSGTRAPLTVSIGVAALGHDVGGNLDDLLGVADRRLYLAKEGGRNRICVNDEGHSTFA